MSFVINHYGPPKFFLFFWPSPKKVCPSLVYTIKVYGGVEKYLRSLRISVLNREELSTTSCGSLPLVKRNSIRVDYDSEQDPARLDFMEKTKFLILTGFKPQFIDYSAINKVILLTTATLLHFRFHKNEKRKY